MFRWLGVLITKTIFKLFVVGLTIALLVLGILGALSLTQVGMTPTHTPISFLRFA
jgi:hypothetical protein